MGRNRPPRKATTMNTLPEVLMLRSQLKDMEEKNADLIRQISKISKRNSDLLNELTATINQRVEEKARLIKELIEQSDRIESLTALAESRGTALAKVRYRMKMIEATQAEQPKRNFLTTIGRITKR